MTVAASVTPSRPKFRLSETLKNFWVDIALFLMFIVDMNTHFTGIPIHEWLGIVFGGALIYHLLLHWQWIVTITRKLIGKLPAIQRIRYVLDLLLFIDMVIVVASGILISEAALPQLGISLQHSFYWSRLHHTTSELIVWLVGIHLALSWPWITTSWSHYVWQPLTGRKQPSNEKLMTEGESA